MLANKELQKEFDEILGIILNFKNKNDLFLFMRDLLSENEILEVAKMLDS